MPKKLAGCYNMMIVVYDILYYVEIKVATGQPIFKKKAAEVAKVSFPLFQKLTISWGIRQSTF